MKIFIAARLEDQELAKGLCNALKITTCRWVHRVRMYHWENNAGRKIYAEQDMEDVENSDLVIVLDDYAYRTYTENMRDYLFGYAVALKKEVICIGKKPESDAWLAVEYIHKAERSDILETIREIQNRKSIHKVDYDGT